MPRSSTVYLRATQVGAAVLGFLIGLAEITIGLGAVAVFLLLALGWVALVAAVMAEVTARQPPTQRWA